MTDSRIKRHVRKIFVTDRSTKIFWFSVTAGIVIRILWAPLTGYAFDIGAFLKHDELYYIAHMNPLYWWSYGVSYLGILLGFFPLKLLVNLMGVDNIYVTHIVLKLPFMLADAGMAIVLYYLVRSLRIPHAEKTDHKNFAFAVALLWWVNPFVIFISSVHGMFDALPVLFMLWAIFYARHQKPLQSYATLAVATTIKLFPFFLFPFFFLYFWPKFRFVKQLPGILVAALVGIVSFAPLLVPEAVRQTFLNSIFFHTSGVISDPSAFSLWRVFFDSEIIFFLPPSLMGKLFFMIFIPAFAVLFLKSLWDIVQKNVCFDRFLVYVTAILILLLPYNTGNVIQYYLWVLPLLLIWAAVYRRFSLALLGVLTILVFGHFFSGVSPFEYFANALPRFAQNDWPFLNDALNILLGFAASLTLIFILGTLLKKIRQPVPDIQPLDDVLLHKTGMVAVATFMAAFFVFFSVSYADLRLPPVAVADRDRYFNYINEPTDITVRGDDIIYTFDLPHVPLISDRAWDHAVTVIYDNVPLTRSSDDPAVEAKNRRALQSLSFAIHAGDVPKKRAASYRQRFITDRESFKPVVSMAVNGKNVPVILSEDKPQVTTVNPTPFHPERTMEAISVTHGRKLLAPETEVVLANAGDYIQAAKELPKLYIETQIAMDDVAPWYANQIPRLIIILSATFAVTLAGFGVLYRMKKYVE